MKKKELPQNLSDYVFIFFNIFQFNNVFLPGDLSLTHKNYLHKKALKKIRHLLTI